MDTRGPVMYAGHMLGGIKIYTSDAVWREILADLGATILDAPIDTELNFDDLDISPRIDATKLKSVILAAIDNGDIVRRVLGANVTLPWIQARIIALLYKTGGMRSSDLRAALGISPDISTHVVDNAIYRLRHVYGHDFIKNDNGVYRIGGI